MWLMIRCKDSRGCLLSSSGGPCPLPSRNRPSKSSSFALSMLSAQLQCTLPLYLPRRDHPSWISSPTSPPESSHTYVVGQAHLRCVNLEYLPLCFQVRGRELDFSVDSPWSNQGWVKSLYFVSRHDDLDFSHRVESVKLIQKL